MTRAGYARISDDREGRELGVARQQEDIAAAFGDVEMFTDNDIGASTRSRKRRPAYEDMMARAEAGEFETIVFYTTSRLTRRPLEYERLITLAETRGTKFVSLRTGQVDLSTADGRMVARILAAADAAEAERIGERVARSHAQLRASGRTTSSPPFGYRAGMRVDPGEAAAIRSAAEILLRGGTVGEVLRVWTAAGVKRRRGQQGWTYSGLKAVLASPTICGHVAHQGQPAAVGQWEPILSRAQWDAVQVALAPGGRRAPGSNTRRHLLSGFLRCEPCGSVLRVGSGGKYVCRTLGGGCGKISRSAAWLEQWVDDAITVYLQTHDLSGEVEKAQPSEVPALERRITEAREMFMAGAIGREDFQPMLVALRDKVNAALAAEASVARKVAVSDEDSLAVWRDGTLDQRRALLSRVVERFDVRPLGRIGRRPPPDDSVVAHWRAAE